MKTITTEFPDFDDDLQAIAAQLGAGWIDSSWHNDSCPSLTNEESNLTLFVDYIVPDRREFPDLPRFQLIDLSTTSHNELVASNELSDVLAFLSRRSAAS